MSRKSNREEFISKANQIHSNKFVYDKVVYVNSRTKVCIVCPIHGEFWQTPSNHISGQECFLCGVKKSSMTKTYDNELFIKLAKQKHSNLQYDYSLVQYNNSNDKVKIFCNKCQKVFLQKPKKHLQGDGCPYCTMSKGEKKIEQWLKEKSISFIPQMTFENCRGKKRPLPFDFYLPELNTCIEYDGKQHFELSFSFDNQERFQKTKTNDKIKNKYCESNNISLIRISYKDNVISVLEQKLH